MYSLMPLYVLYINSGKRYKQAISIMINKIAPSMFFFYWPADNINGKTDINFREYKFSWIEDDLFSIDVRFRGYV